VYSRDVFVHFLDHEILDLYNIAKGFRDDEVLAESTSALRIGYLFTTGSLLVPLSSYFESGLARAVLRSLRTLGEVGDLQIVASSEDYATFIYEKQEQYKHDRKRYPLYFAEDGIKELLTLRIPLKLRRASSTRQITRGWKNSLTDLPDLWSPIFASGNPGSTEQFENSIDDLPERLEGSAFIWSFVKPLLPVSDVTPAGELSLKRLISEHYVRSYIEEFEACILTGLNIGELDFGVPIDWQFPMREVRRTLRTIGIEVPIDRLSWVQSRELRYSPAFIVFASAVRKWITEGGFAEVAHKIHLLSARGEWARYTDFDRILAAAEGIANLIATGEIARQGEENRNHPLEALVRLVGPDGHVLPATASFGDAVASPSLIIINRGNLSVSQDNYKIGQAGAVGPGAHAHDMNFNQIWNESAARIDTAQLATDLSQLRENLLKQASEPEQYIAIGEVAAAEAAAKAGDGPKALEHIKKAGSWVWDTGAKIGIGVAIAAAKGALGL
jgi:hypothetical protein